jgi:hypothetical protein
MKFLKILAAASLALAPAMASAGSGSPDNTDTGGRPISGPLAGRALAGPTVPTGVIILGGLVLVGGAVVAILGTSDSNNNTND